MKSCRRLVCKLCGDVTIRIDDVSCTALMGVHVSILMVDVASGNDFALFEVVPCHALLIASGGW